MESELRWDDLARGQPGVFERSREVWISSSPLGILVGLALALGLAAVVGFLFVLTVVYLL
jgi:hypothetical protein